MENPFEICWRSNGVPWEICGKSNRNRREHEWNTISNRWGIDEDSLGGLRGIDEAFLMFLPSKSAVPSPFVDAWDRQELRHPRIRFSLTDSRSPSFPAPEGRHASRVLRDLIAPH